MYHITTVFIWPKKKDQSSKRFSQTFRFHNTSMHLLVLQPHPNTMCLREAGKRRLSHYPFKHQYQQAHSHLFNAYISYGTAWENLFKHQNIWYLLINRPFYQYGSHIEFIRFKEYYGMPRGHSLSIWAQFLHKKRTLLYISWKKVHHYYIQTRHSNLFFPLRSFSKKTYRKIGPKSKRKYWASILDCSHAPWASHNTP